MIKYVIGDVTKPVGDDGCKFVVHVCNDIGAWGAGVSGAIGKRWPKAERLYRDRDKIKDIPLKLGSIIVASIPYEKHEVHVVNLVGQHGLRSKTNPKPIRYNAIQEGLNRLFKLIQSAEMAYSIDMISVHMPRIGCGLAGGRWGKIEPIIAEELSDKDVTVYVYDLKKGG